MNVGEILAPKGRNYVRSGSLFHERYSGNLVCEADSPAIEKAGVRFSDLKSTSYQAEDLVQVARLSGSEPNGLFAREACEGLIMTSWSPLQAESSFIVLGDQSQSLPVEEKLADKKISMPETQSPSTMSEASSSVPVAEDGRAGSEKPGISERAMPAAIILVVAGGLIASCLLVIFIRRRKN